MTYALLCEPAGTRISEGLVPVAIEHPGAAEAALDTLGGSLDQCRTLVARAEYPEAAAPWERALWLLEVHAVPMLAAEQMSALDGYATALVARVALTLPALMDMLAEAL